MIPARLDGGKLGDIPSNLECVKDFAYLEDVIDAGGGGAETSSAEC